MELTVLGCSGQLRRARGRRVQRLSRARRRRGASGWTAATARSRTCSSTSNPGDLTAVVHHARASRPLRRHLRPARDVQVRPRAAAACRCTRPKASRSALEGLVGDWTDTFDWKLGRRRRPRRRSATRALRFSRTDHPPPTVGGRDRARRQAARVHRRHRTGMERRGVRRRVPTSCSRRRRTSTTTSVRRSTSRRARPASCARGARRGG